MTSWLFVRRALFPAAGGWLFARCMAAPCRKEHFFPVKMGVFCTVLGLLWCVVVFGGRRGGIVYAFSTLLGMSACWTSGVCLCCTFFIRMGGWEPDMPMSLFGGVCEATRPVLRVCALVVQREAGKCVADVHI